MNKIKVITPKRSLIDNIGTPSNSPSKCTLAIVDSGENVHIAKQATPTMDPVTISKDTT